MEVQVLDRLRPVGVDVRHILPGRERAGKGVEQSLLGVPDFCDACGVQVSMFSAAGTQGSLTENIINIGNDGDTRARDEERSGIARLCSTLYIHIEKLQLISLISR